MSPRGVRNVDDEESGSLSPYPEFLMLTAFPYFSTGPGRPVILSHKINIIDVDSSKPVVVPIGANVTTIVNATVIITCPTKGSPQPIVTWKHDRRFIVAGTRYQVNDTALIIRELRLDDAGRYECTASNRFGRDVQSLSLGVTGTISTKYYSVFRYREVICLKLTVFVSFYFV